MTDKTRTPRYYDHLGVWERVRLRIAAYARKDQDEEQRLADTAPIRELRGHHHFQAEMALNILTLNYITEQLESVGGLFYALAKFPRSDKAIDRTEDRDLALLMMLHDFNAYFIHVRSQAWRRLCRDIGVDPDAIVEGNYKGWMLGFVEEEVVQHVPDRERLMRRFAEWGKAPKSIMDAESEYQSMRRLLQNMSSEIEFEPKSKRT